MPEPPPGRARRRLLIHLALAIVTVASVGPTLGRGLMLYDLGELLWMAVFVDDAVEEPERSLEAAAPDVHRHLLDHHRQVGTAGRAALMRRR